MKRKQIASMVTCLCINRRRHRARGAGQVHRESAGRTRILRVQGIRRMASDRHQSDRKAVAVILGNPVMIEAYRAGIPANGKPVPDGAKMAKIHWAPKPRANSSRMRPTGRLVNVDSMVKDSKRFADSGGWGYAVFDYNAASDTFTPGTTAGTPPQGNDAKCGFACHTLAKKRDYVFTEFPKR